MEPEDTRSVRVEFDSADSFPLEPTVPGASPRSKRRALVLAALGVIGVVAMLVVLRPAEDETADGNARGTTTTSAPSTPTSSTPLKEISYASAQGLFEHNEIARSGSGFLALQFEEAENGPPRLLRSTDDGLTWSLLVTTLDSPSEAPGAVVLRDYQSLIATDSGFALLMSTIRIRDDDPIPLFEIVRLTSSTGANWTRDPAFEVVAGFSFDFFRPVHHSPSAIVVTGSGGPSDRLNEIVRAAVRADVLVGEVCGGNVIGGAANDSDPGTIEFFYCEVGTAEINADDLIDPESFEELRQCLAGLEDGAGGPDTMIITREGREPVQALMIPEMLVVPPVVLDDGTLVVLDLDGEFTSTTLCAGFFDGSPSVPGLLRWDVDEAEPARFWLPPDFFTDFAISSMAVGDRVLVIADSALWSISATRGQFSASWSRLAEIPDSTIPRLFDDGRGVVAVTRSSIGVNIDWNPTWDFAELDLPAGTPTVHYADVNTVIITSGTSSFVIDLPLESISDQ